MFSTQLLTLITLAALSMTPLTHGAPTPQFGGLLNYSNGGAYGNTQQGANGFGANGYNSGYNGGQASNGGQSSSNSFQQSSGTSTQSSGGASNGFGSSPGRESAQAEEGFVWDKASKPVLVETFQDPLTRLGI
ncbi:uncharacterized protein PGTG_20224 [Puccinia graminis f. sp. tritici CRL 75-36-700-3]|uniref:Uncharacterized protein n=1 Tax=Puccinia graminis f. sp. tritici (strain CRL 75-36-700-3 / race SCCL) TaxID=418459 RepID=E3LC66_PUCGT|nr:uncharacterized protein PGTG_20224 [Puccinia graminis f. sp. tritici CRL 75-36-700-3]EFP94141.2 hypothetical protein PGTG_20224 [Puccinia graminis f. sp. tritici CRL 75-36-700-3]